MHGRHLSTLLILFALSGTSALEARSDSEAAEPVLVIGRTQQLLGPAAYPAFCEAHATAKRSQLRVDTVKRLKAIADEEREALVAALGGVEDVRPLWLVNGVATRLTKAQQEAACRSEAVRFVYPAGVLPDEGDAGEVATVLRPRRRRSFRLRGKTPTWNLEALRVPRVWDELKITGKGVVVAMYDMGVGYGHEDIEGNLWTNKGEKPNNGRDDDHNGLVDDWYGFNFTRMKAAVIDRTRRQHGTLTTSLVVGDGTGKTVTGAAPRARFMPLIAFGGPYVACRAFQYALEEGADVVNMSFSIPDLGHTRGLWRLMAEHASACGLVLVSGAGNFQRQKPVPVQIRIPEGIPCVICVGGVSRDLSVPGFVSLGPVDWSDVAFYEDHPHPPGLIKPDVCAFPGPGVGLIAPGSSGYLPADNPRRGNSLSAPQVAGVIALMLEANPDLTPWHVKAILEETARDLGDEGKDARTGAGLLDGYAAVKTAQEQASPATAPR